jgi:hypothetical protein
MEFQLYDLATLLTVRRHIDRIPMFWSILFTRQINFETPYIDFEKVNTRYRRLAPFVAPNAQGRVVHAGGSRMQRFSPAYVKIKTPVDMHRVISRVVGEVPYQPLSNEQRRAAVIGQDIIEHTSRIDNRFEWLCANAVIYGEVTIEGEDYPARVVNFGRDPSLTMTLITTARWSQSTGKPLDDIKLMRRRAKDLCGKVIRRVVFGTNAWDLFVERLQLNNPQNGNLLDTTYRGSETNVSRLLDGFEGAEYAGAITGVSGQGRIECWVYSATYEDETGATQNFMHPDDVVGLGDFEGTRCYGAIMDAKAGYRSMEVFMKNWVNEDPSVEYLLSQSAPLAVPGEPNATFRIRVNG